MNLTASYTNKLVNSLLRITELNSQINEFYLVLEKSNSKFLKLKDDVKNEILFDFSECISLEVRYSEAKKVILGTNKSPETAKERALVNIQNIFDYVESSFHYEYFGLPILTHINKVFLSDIKDIWDSAKLIVREDEIDNAFDFCNKTEIYNQMDFPKLMNILDEYYINDETPDILKSFLIFYKLIKSRYFVAGNDATTLSVLYFMLRKLGFNSFTNIFRVLKTLKEDFNNDENFNTLVERFFEELELSLSDLKTKLEYLRDETTVIIQDYLDLNIRQIKALTYIKERGNISREICAKLNDTSSITAYRDLNFLLQKGYVSVEGIGKATKYILSIKN